MRDEGSKLFWTLLAAVIGAGILSGGSAVISLRVIAPQVEEIAEWKRSHVKAHSALVRRVDRIHARQLESYRKLFGHYPPELTDEGDDQ